MDFIAWKLSLIGVGLREEDDQFRIKDDGEFEEVLKMRSLEVKDFKELKFIFSHFQAFSSTSKNFLPQEYQFC